MCPQDRIVVNPIHYIAILNHNTHALLAGVRDDCMYQKLINCTTLLNAQIEPYFFSKRTPTTLSSVARARKYLLEAYNRREPRTHENGFANAKVEVDIRIPIRYSKLVLSRLFYVELETRVLNVLH
jgi:hypothetical protein